MPYTMLGLGLFLLSHVASHTTVIDDFTSPDFNLNSNWAFFQAGDFVGNDGHVSVGKHGLTVVSPGTVDGHPAYTLEAESDLDHVKWLVTANHTASSGYPGFDTGCLTSCSARLRGEVYGVEENDPRPAFVASVNGDFERSFMFDFAVTNDAVYALYERLPFARTEDNHYASFTYLVRAAGRSPEDWHDMRVTYDRAARTVTWYFEGEVVLKVDKVGHYLGPEHESDLYIDRGGEEEEVPELRQLTCGIGSFSLMDSTVDGKSGLVRLVEAEGYYVRPAEFLDGDRLIGQGTKLEVASVSVSIEEEENENETQHDEL